jgi:hypothetical protein
VKEPVQKAQATSSFGDLCRKSIRLFSRKLLIIKPAIAHSTASGSVIQGLNVLGIDVSALGEA